MVARATQTVVMALFLIFCPLVGLLEPIKGPDPELIRKMIAEGGSKETITLLGWYINTRIPTITLTHEKATSWAAKIKTMQKSRKKAKAKDLQTLIGKLNHVCFVIQDAGIS